MDMVNYFPSPTKSNNSNRDEGQRNAVVKPKPVTYTNPFNKNKLITDDKGNVTGIDTGTQSRLLTPVEQIIYSKPKSSGGGGSSGGTITNTSSPTGYSDVLNQPVSVALSRGNTLSNQSSSSIGPLQDYGFVKPYQQSFGGALVQTGKNALYNIGTAFGREDRNYRDTFEPLQRYGTFNSKSFLPKNLIGFGTPSLNVFGGLSSFETRGTSFTKSREGQLPIIKQQEEITSGFTTKANEYSSEVSSKAQAEYNTAFDIAQGGVSSGTWSLSQGQDYLKQVGSSIETKSKTQIDTYNKNLQGEYSTSMNLLEGKRQNIRKSVYAGQIGLGTIAKTGIEFGALAVGGPELAIAYGTKEIVMGGMEQDPWRVAGGFAVTNFAGIGKFRGIAKEISSEQALGDLSKSSFGFAEKRFTGEELIKGIRFGETNELSISKSINFGKEDFSRLKGTRIGGGLTQDINVGGKVFSSGEVFLQPGSKFTSQISGTIDSAWGGGLFKIKPQAYIGGITGKIGSAGVTTSISGLKTGEGFITRGKGIIKIESESFGITDINKLKSGGFGFDSTKLSNSFKSNIKSYDNKYTSDYFSGISKKVGDNLYISKSGKSDIGSLNINKITSERDININLGFVEANQKDITFTQVIPKSGLKGSVEMEFSKSGLQGFTQVPKMSGSGLISSSLIQEGKAGLVPKLLSKPTSFSSKGFGGSARGLSSLSGLSQVRSKDTFSSGFSSKNIGTGNINVGLNTNALSSSFVSSGIGSSFGSSLSSLPSSSLRQPQMQSQSLGQLQLSKLDLSMKNITPSQLQSFNFISPGPGGFGGFDFGFPGIGLPSFGGGLGYAKPKTKSKKRKTKIAPSLTSSLFDLRGALPKGGSFGVSPFQLRRIPKGQKNPYATKF